MGKVTLLEMANGRQPQIGVEYYIVFWIPWQSQKGSVPMASHEKPESNNQNRIPVINNHPYLPHVIFWANLWRLKRKGRGFFMQWRHRPFEWGILLLINTNLSSVMIKRLQKGFIPASKDSPVCEVTWKLRVLISR